MSGHGGHHGGGGHGWGGRWGGGWGTRGPWGPAYDYPFYLEEADDDVAASTFYRGYVITQTSAGFEVAKAGSTEVLKTFRAYNEARAYVDSLPGLKGLGEITNDTKKTLGLAIAALAIGYWATRKRRKTA